MNINPSAFFAESRRVQDELKCRRSTADSIVAARYLRGKIDDDMKTTGKNKPLIVDTVRTDAEILKDDEQ